MLTIRPATEHDREGVWEIIKPVIRAGETYTLPRDMPKADALLYWMGADREVFAAQEDGALRGTYYIRPNHMGGGSHVANCGYMTHPDFYGSGIARAMCAHSISYAMQRGFRGMQFNFVVGTNERAVRLWQSLGFATVGRVPHAFRRPRGDEVDSLIMYRKL